MINISNLTLQFGTKVIFNQCNLFINEKQRIGIVGLNGTGKTTLMRVIAGSVQPDKGEITLPARKKIAMLEQEAAEMPELPIISYLKKGTGIADIEEKLSATEKELELHHGQEDLLLSYQKLTEEFQFLEGYSFDARAKQILKGLGFADADFAKLCTEFSGGWRIRLSLALILLQAPDIMLLDEPTNHLDTESMEWLENYLNNYRGTIITISHDRRFLDKIVNTILEIARGRFTLYAGNYAYYEVEKVKRLELLEKEVESQLAERERVLQFVDRFRYKASKATQVQSRLKQLEKMEIIQLEEGNKSVSIRFPEGVKSGNEVITVQNISKKYGDLTVFEKVNFLVQRDERVALVGVNGAGKSTLTRIISQTEEPTAGTVKIGHNVKTAYFSQQSSDNLNGTTTIWEEVNEVKAKYTEAERRSLLGAFLFSGDDIYKKISVLSGGEKSRVALLKLLMQESNLLILDEPTNHLDSRTKEIFQEALLEYGGTLILVSHDRYFLDSLATRVIEIRDQKIIDYPGNYSYFIEKRADLLNSEQNQVVAKSDKKAVVQSTAEVEGFKSKEQKRAEAEKRNSMSGERKKLQKDLEKVEALIQTLEAEKESLENDLCNPEILKDGQKVSALQKRLNENSNETEAAFENWTELGEKLEELIAELNAG